MEGGARKEGERERGREGERDGATVGPTAKNITPREMPTMVSILSPSLCGSAAGAGVGVERVGAAKGAGLGVVVGMGVVVASRSTHSYLTLFQHEESVYLTVE